MFTEHAAFGFFLFLDWFSSQFMVAVSAFWRFINRTKYIEHFMTFWTFKFVAFNGTFNFTAAFFLIYNIV